MKNDELDENQRAWIESMIDAPFVAWHAAAERLRKRHREDLVAEIARRRLAKRGASRVNPDLDTSMEDPDGYLPDTMAVERR